MWMQQGRTNRRQLTEQSQAVALGAAPVTIPFNQLKTVGYLKGLRLYAPTWTGTMTLGGGTFRDLDPTQYNHLRQIQIINIINQGVAPIYQNITGLDLAFLNLVGNGKHPSQRRREIEQGFVLNHALIGGGAYPYLYAVGAPPASGQSDFPFLFADQTTGPTLAGAYAMEIPISEWLIFPGTAIGQVGNAVLVSEAPIECGMLFMQSNAQSVTPYISASALYGPRFGSVFQQAVQVVNTGSPTNVGNATYALETDFYDVSPNPADHPSGFQINWAITRTARDLPMIGGSATYVFANAGLLLRVIYEFYNDTAPGTGYGTLWDLQPSLGAQVQVQSGATILKRTETVQNNRRRALTNYGYPLPGSILVNDWIPDNIVTDAIDTSDLVSPEVVFTGFDSAITRVRVVEERALPLKNVA